jgi:hypothetical protein
MNSQANCWSYNFRKELIWNQEDEDDYNNNSYYLFTLTIDAYLASAMFTTIKHNTQITRITWSNAPRSNQTQHTDLHNH